MSQRLVHMMNNSTWFIYNNSELHVIKLMRLILGKEKLETSDLIKKLWLLDNVTPGQFHWK